MEEEKQNNSQTDWERFHNMTDEEIDFSDCPPVTDEMFKNAFVRKNFKPYPNRNQEFFPIDLDIIAFFKSQHFNYPAKINELLREYMENAKKAG